MTLLRAENEPRVFRPQAQTVGNSTCEVQPLTPIHDIETVMMKDRERRFITWHGQPWKETKEAISLCLPIFGVQL
jgi:hypothetical protein